MPPRVLSARHLAIAFCVLMACCGTHLIEAQTTLPDKGGPARVEDIQIGMDRDKVLAALAGKYDLNQEDLGEGIEAWVVVDKKGSSESCKIIFTDKKVGAIWFRSLPHLKGDAVVLARDLFTTLYLQAKRPNRQTSVADTFNTKEITVPVTLERLSGTNGEWERITFSADNHDYVLEVELPVQGEPHVSVARLKNKNAQ